jgi:hypothetical protein
LQASEYARLIGVPNVTNLKENYNHMKLLLLIKHGNEKIWNIYIQENQKFNDQGLIWCIVDLLADTEKPEEMIREVSIEFEIGNENGSGI